MAAYALSLLPVFAMNPPMTFAHTTPFSALQTSVRVDLREYIVVQIPYDYSRLEAQLLTPMNSIAHERQLVTAQLGRNNDDFEKQHTDAIARFLTDQDRTLSELTQGGAKDRDYWLSFSTPTGTEDISAARQTPLLIDVDVTPPPSPRSSIKPEPSSPAIDCMPLSPTPAPSAMLRHKAPVKVGDAISVDSDFQSSDFEHDIPLPQVLEKLDPRREQRGSHNMPLPRVAFRPALEGDQDSSATKGTRVKRPVHFRRHDILVPGAEAAVNPSRSGKRDRDELGAAYIKPEAGAEGETAGASTSFQAKKRMRFDHSADEGLEDLETEAHGDFRHETPEMWEGGEGG